MIKTQDRYSSSPVLTVETESYWEKTHVSESPDRNLIFSRPMAGSVIAGTPSPEGARVYIISPANGDIVSSPVTITFGLKGMGVAPAGIEKAGTGHHHLLIDLADIPVVDQPVPAADRHKHFDGGQTEATIELDPGVHTLQLIVGDRSHVPHEPAVVSDKITVTVK